MTMRPDPELARRIAGLEAENHALRARAEASAEQAAFRLAEVEHRLMNIFATIQALANLTARPGDTGDAFRATFDARLLALARSHEMLGSARADGTTRLDEVIGQCLQPYDDASNRIGISGPAVHLPARDVPALGLVLHELSTNAVKYGALSVPAGRIDVTWQTRMVDRACAVGIAWTERDGPPVRPPERRGFGSLLLRRGLPFASNGSVQLDFPPSGVTCRIQLSLPLHGGGARARHPDRRQEPAAPPGDAGRAVDGVR
ncbi:MAG: sensor histidine kinase [Gluconacetobacter diazotrophicus]|nr:sensor histidine kinase [Gluconacetobacter diazotrophicus]